MAKGLCCCLASSSGRKESKSLHIAICLQMVRQAKCKAIPLSLQAGRKESQPDAIKLSLEGVRGLGDRFLLLIFFAEFATITPSIRNQGVRVLQHHYG